MGQGTMVLFNDFALQIGEYIHNFPSGGEDYEAYIIDNTKVAAATDASPDVSDYTEVSGGTYVKKTLANQDYTLVAAIATFVADAITWAQDAASGPIDCYQVLIVLDGAQCMAFIDLTLDGGVTPLSLKAAPIGINFGSGTNAIFTAEANAA